MIKEYFRFSLLVGTSRYYPFPCVNTKFFFFEVENRANIENNGKSKKRAQVQSMYDGKSHKVA